LSDGDHEPAVHDPYSAKLGRQIMSSLGMLNKLVEFEVALGDLYRWLSKVYEYDQDTSSTFTQLNMRKQANANLIRHERKLVTLDSTAMIPMAAEPDDVDNLLGRIQEFRDSGNDPDLCNAIDLGRILEGSSAVKLYRSTVVEGSQARTPFVEKLAAGALKNVELLEGRRASYARLHL
jgi:hypothetical protein